MKNTFIYKKQIYQLIDPNAITYKRKLEDEKKDLKNNQKHYNSWTSTYLELQKKIAKVNSNYSEMKMNWILSGMAVRVDEQNKTMQTIMLKKPQTR